MLRDMDRDPGDFDKRDGSAAHDGDDASVGRLIGDGLDSGENLAAAIAEAEGRVVLYDRVAAWLDTWGTPEFKPMPAEWLS